MRSLHMDEKVIVVGDGPIALATVILLKRVNYSPILVGSRIGSFTRSGHVVDRSFKHVAEFMKLPIKPSYTYHIKDFERQLYSHVLELEIECVKGKFIDFKSKKIQIVKDDEIIELDCDVVIDCTGGKRAVIKSANQYLEETEQFKIEEINFGTNFHPHWGLVRGVSNEYLFPSDADDTHTYHQFQIRNEGLDVALALMKLREQGWPYNRLPWGYEARFVNENAKSKTNIFFEIPPNLKNEEEIILFLKNTLIAYDLNYEGYQLKINTTSKHSEKKAVVAYNISPHQVERASYPGGEKLPIILHAGDASMNLPFLSGAGLLLGFFRLENQLIQICDDRKSFAELNFTEYDEFYRQDCERMINDQKGPMAIDAGRIEGLQEQFLTLYMEALCSPLNNNEEKKIVRQALEGLIEETNNQYNGTITFDEIQEYYLSTKDKNPFPNTNSNSISPNKNSFFNPENDIGKNRKELLLSIKQGSKIAWVELGYCFLEGKMGCKQNNDEAKKSFLIALQHFSSFNSVYYREQIGSLLTTIDKIDGIDKTYSSTLGNLLMEVENKLNQIYATSNVEDKQSDEIKPSSTGNT